MPPKPENEKALASFTAKSRGRVIGADELMKHATADDGWVCIKSKVRCPAVSGPRAARSCSPGSRSTSPRPFSPPPPPPPPPPFFKFDSTHRCTTSLIFQSTTRAVASCSPRWACPTRRTSSRPSTRARRLSSSTASTLATSTRVPLRSRRRRSTKSTARSAQRCAARGSTRQSAGLAARRVWRRDRRTLSPPFRHTRTHAPPAPNY